MNEKLEKLRDEADSVTASIRFPTDLYRKITKAAARDSRTFASLVRFLCAEYLERQAANPQ
jgi:predicted DNA-binding protein